MAVGPMLGVGLGLGVGDGVGWSVGVGAGLPVALDAGEGAPVLELGSPPAGCAVGLGAAAPWGPGAVLGPSAAGAAGRPLRGCGPST